MEINIPKFKEVVANNNRLRWICRLLADRERSRQDATAERYTKLLQDKGVMVKRSEVREDLMTLAKLGVCDSVSRLNGGKVVWNFEPISIGKVGLGEELEFKPLHLKTRVHFRAPKVSKSWSSGQSSSIVVKCKDVTVEIPANASEAKIQEVIQTLMKRG